MDIPLRGLILDTTTLVDAERHAETIGQLLHRIRGRHGARAVGVSTITIVELAHGLRRAKTASQRMNREDFLVVGYFEVAHYRFSDGVARGYYNLPSHR